MKIDGKKTKEVKVGMKMQWTQDCEYGKAGEFFYPSSDEIAFASLMYGNGLLKNSLDNPIIKQDGAPSGQHIVVLDRGFVYVGDVSINGNYVNIKDAQCIRFWGTTNGLSQLINGPLPTTKLDSKCDIVTTLKSVIHFIKCQGF